uniref:Collagen type VI alpha 6 chain n=1 Tax=Erpetoichthys calabaricus TaxID=27687 RepID=A0A8C4XD08_ERPCA
MHCKKASVADIVFVVDGSSSIGEPNFQQLRDFLYTFVDSLDVSVDNVRVGLAQYSDDAHKEFLLNTFSNKSEILTHIQDLAYRKGGTYTGKALEFIKEQYFTPSAGSRVDKGVPQIAIVLTDGESSDNVSAPANELRKLGVLVYVIGINVAEYGELKEIANNFHRASGLPFFTGLHSVGYLTDLFSFCFAVVAPLLADVVFLVDESGSISSENFKQIRSFISNIVNVLDVSSDKVRIGVVLYSDSPNVEFFLNTFFSKEEVLQQVQKLPFRGGGANTGRALDYLRTEIFQESVGSRKAQGVQQIAVVITDGISSDNVSLPAANLRRDGITIFAVGVQEADISQLRQIASHPPRKYVHKVENYLELSNVKKSLQKLLCNDILVQAFVIPKVTRLIAEGCEETEEADIYFLIDGSGSIYPQDFLDMKKFIIAMTKMFRIGKEEVRIGVVQYSLTTRLEFSVAQYGTAKEITIAVKNIAQLGGGTETGAALKSMENHFREAARTRQAKVPQFLITITDGKSDDSVVEAANSLRSMGVLTYAVGIRDADMAEIEQIAGVPERMFYVNNFDSLKQIKDEVVRKICSKEVCKQKEADVIFLIDGSGSIFPVDFDKMKGFMEAMVDKSDIGPDKVQFGLLQFSDSPREEFQLNAYDNQLQLKQEITNMEQLGGGTNTGAALEFASQYFDQSKGGRPSVRQFLVIITDGEAQDEVSKPAQALRQKGIIIYSIGVENANTTQLLEISGGIDKVHSINNFDDLRYVEDKIIFEICTQEETCKRMEVADVMFVVDGSGSIQPEQFVSMQKFMMSLVNISDVGKDKVHFGAVVYSNQPDEAFRLNQYFTKDGLKDAIWKMHKKGGGTYTASAMTFARDRFTQPYGGRMSNNVSRVMIVITDGAATDRIALPIASRDVHKQGISVYAVGVGNAKTQDLEIMAGTKNKVFYCDGGTISSVCQWKCEVLRGDIVILLDGSESISKGNFTITLQFMKEVVNHFKIGEKEVRIGVAQFSTNVRKEFYLNEFYAKEDIFKRIDTIDQIEEGTRTGNALTFVRSFFTAEAGSRKAQGVPQNLLIITDGDSKDPVEEPAKALRAENINIYVIGVGNLNDFDLIKITGDSNRVFPITNFNAPIEVILTPFLSNFLPDCNIDIAVGFDISKRTRPTLFFSGQPNLQVYFPEIMAQISSVAKISCASGSQISVRLGYHLATDTGKVIYDTRFENYSTEIVEKLMTLQTREATFLNERFLQDFADKFTKDSNAKVKVLLIFSDGLDSSVEIMEEESRKLQGKGIHTLVTVALDGIFNANDLQRIEFGRGFGYNSPLAIGMQNVAGAIYKELDSVFERECCCVSCKCVGQEGPRGPRGMPGLKVSNECKVGTRLFIGVCCPPNTIYPYCPYFCKSDCPSYPTDLVIALDMSEDVTPTAFERMRNVTLSIVDQLAITESNCPTGARVAVVTFNTHTKYLIRFSDYLLKSKLINSIRQIALERTSNQRNIGAAMRFVAQHAFKRVRKGMLVRKVAVFIANGASQDVTPINTAVLEFKALDITPVVIAFKNVPNVVRAFATDQTRSFLVRVLERQMNQEEQLRYILRCSVCYDVCSPSEECSQVNLLPVPQPINMDLTFVVDGSRNIRTDEYEGIKELLNAVLNDVIVSDQVRPFSAGARIALVQHSPLSHAPRQGQSPVTLEFDLEQYRNRNMMKRHISEKMRQVGGSSSVGYAIDWVMKNIMNKSRPRSLKVIFAIVGGETSEWDREKLLESALVAKCQGVAMFVLTVGRKFSSSQIEDLASDPLSQHVVYLGRVQLPEIEYAERFSQAFFSLLNSKFSFYLRILHCVSPCCKKPGPLETMDSGTSINQSITSVVY